MKALRCSLVVSLIPIVFGAVPLAAVDVHDTRMLSEPAVSATHVAFAYADDLWIAALGDGPLQARRLTSHPGRESNPRFSPDGEWLAFSAHYDGNVDVYLVAVAGGEPRRLTWHPDADEVLDFVAGADDEEPAVLFRSQRVSHTRRFHQLFTVPVTGGFPSQLPIPHAFKAAVSPDGGKIAYVPLREAFRQWKNYRGGTTSRIWIYDVGDHSVVQIPQPDGRCNDTDPMWIGSQVLFLSDRNGEFNLFAFDPEASAVSQLTEHEEFPIQAASAGSDRVVYEQAGYLHLFDPAARAGDRLQIGAAADLAETRPRYARGSEFLRSADLSPSGARVVVDFRGELVSVPAKKGDPRYLTRTPGVHENFPVWSPNGDRIAYFSDASGEYELHVADPNGQGEVRTYPLGGAGFYTNPRWSPDGEKLSFVDNSRTIYWIALDSGKVTPVSSDVLYGPIPPPHHAWSPDSKWLAYTRNNESYFQQVYLYDLEADRSTAITTGLSDVDQPVFDQGGKYLYFLASTDAGPVRTWFAQSSNDTRITHNLYLAVLPKGEASPLAKESDEEASPSDEDGDTGSAESAAEEAAPQVKIDFEGLSQRILALPVPSASMRGLAAGAAGQIYYLATDAPIGPRAAPSAHLKHYDLNQRKEETLLSGVDNFRLSADGKMILASQGTSLVLGEAKGSIDAGAGQVALDAIAVRIDPRSEWRQIFDEVWRINRDYFYDPGMHGADWPAMRARYAQFLPHLSTRDDLNRLIRWLCSELAVGHHRTINGNRLNQPEEIPGGLLGADYAIDSGRYRLAKVYGGLNWNPDLRSPLTEPGVDAVAGEYLLAVDGRELRPPENLYSRFENTAGRIIEITLGSDPEGAGSRTVRVVPVDDESNLRNRDWVEGNLKKVHEATDGRVAYVHVPNTAGQGHTYFKRYFYPQAHKPAIIVDERYNGGGLVADYYIDILRRPLISHWAMRYGADLKTPVASIQGPKIMLIDETAGSGGDLLPYMFRRLGLGTLVGKRTWGGLVGILGFPPLMDSGFVTAPNLAFWDEDGFGIENVGVPPDIEVEQWPADVIAGRDPQLEKAIELALEALEAAPPPEFVRPEYPIRVRQ